jgi:hypothetical protein
VLELFRVVALALALIGFGRRVYRHFEIYKCFFGGRRSLLFEEEWSSGRRFGDGRGLASLAEHGIASCCAAVIATSGFRAYHCEFEGSG